VDERSTSAARGLSAALCACVGEFANRVGPDPEPAIRQVMRQLSEALAADGATWKPHHPLSPLQLWVFFGWTPGAVFPEQPATQEASRDGRVGPHAPRAEALVPCHGRAGAVLMVARRAGCDEFGDHESEALQRVAGLLGRLMDVYGAWDQGPAPSPPAPTSRADGQLLVSDLFALSVELLSRPDQEASVGDVAQAIRRLDQATYRLRRAVADVGSQNGSAALARRARWTDPG